MRFAVAGLERKESLFSVEDFGHALRCRAVGTDMSGDEPAGHAVAGREPQGRLHARRLPAEG